MTENWNSLLAGLGLSGDGTTFGNLNGELLAARDGSVVAPLNDLGLIRATGEDAAVFLHNLVSNDVKGIDASHARFAGLCTPKGRLLALLLIWREDDDLLLMLPRDILPAILKRLSMYVLRSKVKLSDATAERVLIGYASPPNATGLAESGSTASLRSEGGAVVMPPLATDLPRFGVVRTAEGQSLRLDDRRWLLVCTPQSAISLWKDHAVTATPVGTAAWQWLEIAAGQPRVVTATQEAFVPQMLNMELPAVAGVSFTKGCYPGQEIVARTQYLGKVKRRTFRARLAIGAAPGTPVFSPETGDQQCGALVSIAPSPNGGFEALVCAQISALEAGELHVGGAAGEPMELLSLPYAIN